MWLIGGPRHEYQLAAQLLDHRHTPAAKNRSTANLSNPALVGKHLGHEPQLIRGSNHKAALSKVGYQASLS